MADLQVRVRNLYGDTNTWNLNNLVLGRGEIGIEETITGNQVIKVGDGSTQFKQLKPLTTEAVALSYLNMLNPVAASVPPSNSFFIDISDSKLKFKDATGTVRAVSLE